jgi:hypothetical protein
MFIFIIIRISHPITRQPLRRIGIRGHAPVASGRQADRPHLRPVRDARPLELLAEEAGVERPHRRFDPLARIILGERSELAQEEDLRGRVPAADRVVQDEIVDLVRAEGRLGGLLDLAGQRGR